MLQIMYTMVFGVKRAENNIEKYDLFWRKCRLLLLLITLYSKQSVYIVFICIILFVGYLYSTVTDRSLDSI
jgi:hypothetical protein